MHTPPCILIVDDQPMNVDILSTRLTLEGYKVLTATDGAEAIAIARNHQPDLILLDVIMPEPDGFEVCRRLKADSTLPFMHIVVISAKAESEDMVAGFEAGADDYLTKPLALAVLVARVGALLRSKARHDAGHDKGVELERQVVQLEARSQALKDQLQDHIIDLEGMGHLRRFLSPEAAEVAVSLRDDEDGLIGDQKEITVVSYALHGFEAFVEKSKPEGVFQTLRDFHQALGPLIDKFGGTLEQFSGDELQVTFSAMAFPNSMEPAVHMALSIREQLVSQCEKWRSSGYGLDVGIGVAHGAVAFGLMELESRLDYAMMGAVRHLASRLGKESQGGRVLIAQSVWEEVEKQFHAELAGKLVLNGYAEPIPFFEVKGAVENPL